MPRPNRLRTIGQEEGLARRIRYEREQRAWSYAGLASRMTSAGCAIDQSALYKIENATPRRRISVDELVALSRAFGIGMSDLLVPPEIVADKQAKKLLDEYRKARAATEAAWWALVDHSAAHPGMSDVFAEHMTAEDIPADMMRATMEQWRAKLNNTDPAALDAAYDAALTRLDERKADDGVEQ